MDTFKCTACELELPRNLFHEFQSEGRKRPVTSKCRKCRKEEYYTKRYNTICICCELHRPLDTNRQCKWCNENMGLKQCVKCKKILPLLLMFRDSRRCITCQENS
jgi:hypothetical protein